VNAISPDELYSRRQICSRCEYYRGSSCSKNHLITGPLACPEGKFSAIVPLFKSGPPRVSGQGCCSPVSTPESASRNLTWAEAIGEFNTQMKLWQQSGFALSSSEEHARRFAICGTCNYYRMFQCQKCKCVAFIKAKLATETCPDGLW